jgi:hypothetical protein
MPVIEFVKKEPIQSRGPVIRRIFSEAQSNQGQTLKNVAYWTVRSNWVVSPVLGNLEGTSRGN